MSFSRLAAATASLCLLCGLSAAAQPPAAGPLTAPPAKWTFKLGTFELTALRDSGFVTPNDGGDFGSEVGPAAVAKLLGAAGLPTDRITLSIDALLVRTPGHLALLDTGVGPSDHGALPQSLALAGVLPGDVTDVLITHAHFDHVGGLVDAAGRLTFPRATIWMSAKGWAWMRGEPDTKDAAVTIADRVKTFEPGQPILPGITAITLDGHTPGHVGYEIVSAGHALEDTGDMAHSSVVSLGEPDWTDGMDVDAPTAAATRHRELARLAAAHELIFAPHFPFPGVGRVEAKGDGFAWKPVAAAISTP
jgi:glyoxylase-like metal-dependent hydrolase (beta-lactamase superfamily II)